MGSMFRQYIIKLLSSWGDAGNTREPFSQALMYQMLKSLNAANYIKKPGIYN